MASAKFQTSVTAPFPLEPLSSTSLAPPTVPLLSTGFRHSSSHLSLLAMDPSRSVVKRDVLLRMKLDVLKKGAGLSDEATQLKKKEREMEMRKKRSARDLAAEMEQQQREKKQKKDKLLPLVPQHSLATLEKQLTAETSTASPTSVVTELAACALARHLVDWYDELGLDFHSDDEEEEEEDEEQATEKQVTQVESRSSSSSESVPTLTPVLMSEVSHETCQMMELCSPTPDHESSHQVELDYESSCESESESESQAATPALELDFTRTPSTESLQSLLQEPQQEFASESENVYDETASESAQVTAAVLEQVMYGSSSASQLSVDVSHAASPFLFMSPALAAAVSPQFSPMAMHAFQLSPLFPTLSSPACPSSFQLDEFPLSAAAAQQQQQQHQYMQESFESFPSCSSPCASPRQLASTETSEGARVTLHAF